MNQISKEVSNSDLFYCYDQDLARFLYKKKSIKYITHAIHPRTRNDFWLFSANQVNGVIEEYNAKTRIT